MPLPPCARTGWARVPGLGTLQATYQVFNCLPRARASPVSPPVTDAKGGASGGQRRRAATRTAGAEVSRSIWNKAGCLRPPLRLPSSSTQHTHNNYNNNSDDNNDNMINKNNIRGNVSYKPLKQHVKYDVLKFPGSQPKTKANNTSSNNTPTTPTTPSTPTVTTTQPTSSTVDF